MDNDNKISISLLEKGHTNNERRKVCGVGLGLVIQTQELMFSTFPQSN